MVEEAIFCHVVHVPAMLVEGRDTCWGGFHTDEKIVARCMHETHSGQKKIVVRKQPGTRKGKNKISI